MTSNTRLGPKNSKLYHTGDTIWSDAANNIEPGRGYRTKSVWPRHEKERFLDPDDIKLICKSCIISLRRLKNGNPDHSDDELLSRAAKEVHAYLTEKAPEIDLKEKYIPDSEYIGYITRLYIRELKILNKKWDFSSDQWLAKIRHPDYY